MVLRDRWKGISNELGIDFNGTRLGYSDKASEKAASGVVHKLEEITIEQAASRAVICNKSLHRTSDDSSQNRSLLKLL